MAIDPENSRNSDEMPVLNKQGLSVVWENVKEYVDNAVSNGSSGGGGGMTEEDADTRYLKLSGGTMTGAIRFRTSTGGVGGVRLEGSTSNGTEVVQLGYTSGGRPTFSFAEHSGASTVPMKVSGVATPESNTDAANKEYVDSLIGNVGNFLDSINGEVI